MTWRPATQRPRNGQRVIVQIGRRLKVGEAFRGIIHCRLGIEAMSFAWGCVDCWIPESELIKAARAAAKGVK
jgi:hypothetical protein